MHEGFPIGHDSSPHVDGCQVIVAPLNGCGAEFDSNLISRPFVSHSSLIHLPFIISSSTLSPSRSFFYHLLKSLTIFYIIPRIPHLQANLSSLFRAFSHEPAAKRFIVSTRTHLLPPPPGSASVSHLWDSTNSQSRSYSVVASPLSLLKMDNQAQSRRNEHLTWVYDQLQGCGEIYLEPAHLRTLQILALPAHVSDGGEVLFHPRFFKAHPARVLGEYPVNQSVMGPANPPRGVPPLCDPPSLEKELWNHVHIADDGDRIQAARDSLADRLSQYWHEWTCVQRVHGHIQSHILAPRFGRPEGSTLCELGALQPSLLQYVTCSPSQ